MNYKHFVLFSFLLFCIPTFSQEHKEVEQTNYTESDSLGTITKKYTTYIAKKYQGASKHENLNFLLDKLPSLEFDKNYVLDDFRSKNIKYLTFGSILTLYARHKSIPHPKDEDFKEGDKEKQFRIICIVNNDSVKPINPFEHITLPYTKESIWQAYLLSQTKRIIGMWWHGAYDHRIFINNLEDLEQGPNGRGEIDYESNLHQYLKKKKRTLKEIWSEEELYPQITLNNDKTVIISHCWFNNHKGLEKVKFQINYNSTERKIEKIELLETTLLIPYNCGFVY